MSILKQLDLCPRCVRPLKLIAYTAKKKLPIYRCGCDKPRSRPLRRSN